jgi:probable FeS assembly SUF system protein SufT
LKNVAQTPQFGKNSRPGENICRGPVRKRVHGLFHAGVGGRAWITRLPGLRFNHFFEAKPAFRDNGAAPSPMHSSLELKREVDAIQIPSGDSIKLPLGMKVIITQSLGGTYTVATDFGLARIQAKDADALGIDPEGDKKAEASTSSNVPTDVSDLEGQVWNQLKNVYDPEIPVNIVDLGLVYDCKVEADAEGKNKAIVKMTLTAPGCGMGPTIAADAQSRIMTIEEMDDAAVELCWDPPWNKDMISIEGKMKLGMI